MSERIPGAYSNEVESTSSVNSLYTEIPVILGKASTGPTSPTEVFTTTGLTKLFGNELDSDFGLMGASKIVSNCEKIIFCRIAHLGSKAQYKKTDALVFEAKEGGTYLNKYKVTVGVEGQIVTISLVENEGSVTLETVIASLDANSEDYIFRVFNTYSQYLNLVADSGSITFTQGLELTRTDGTAGALPSTGTSSGLEVSTKYPDTYYGGCTFTISISAINRISAKLKRGNVIIEHIEEGAIGETTEQFISRFNQSSEILVLTKFSTRASATVTLSAGNAGLNTVSSDYIGNSFMGLKALEDTSSLDMALLCIPGVSDADVVNYAKGLAGTRKDCTYFADPPLGLKAYQTACWADGIGVFAGGSSINTTYCTTASPWVKARDGAGNTIYTPPSVVVIAKMMENNQTKNIWEACAGTDGGLLTDVVGLEYNPSKDDRTILNNSNVNPIIFNTKRGYMVFGDRTGQRIKRPSNPEPGCSLSVRREINYIKKTLTAMSIDYCFKTNDDFSWSEFKLIAEPFLRNIKDNRGLYDFKIVMDESTVTSDKIDALEMPGIIKLKPTRKAEVIDLGFNIYSYGVEFDANSEDA